MDLLREMILEEYDASLPRMEELRLKVLDALGKALEENGLRVTAIESRIKSRDSLKGKLELKGSKYTSLADITDILGVRVIAFYTDDVDKVAALAKKIFDIDWENSVDKRKMHELDSFGYNSLHYICRLRGGDGTRFELQMRTALQHMWANMNHDCGYKSGVEIPVEHLRNLNRLAGMLELADDEFSRIRTAINDYRRKVQALVASGNIREVPLNGDTFRSYLQIGPFDKLNKKIAAINQAEIQEVPMMPYLQVFKSFGFKTLGEVSKCIKDESETAYQLAAQQIGSTDLDIISSGVAPTNICIMHILRNGGGISGLKNLFDTLNGESDYNADRARRTYEQASQLALI